LEIENKAQGKMIITTEKDFVRLKGSIPKEQLFYLPIRSSFLSAAEKFDKTITDYVETRKRTSRN
jgi:tetraacyldisaccharide 4'-kinase